MPKSRHPSEAEPPLYIRWTPDICPYALEMRLGLITRLKGELDQAEALGVEIGGVFVGVFPTPDSPTLRLDDVVFVPRNVWRVTWPGGPEFTLEPAQLQRLAQHDRRSPLHRTSRRSDSFAVTLREASLAPSPADMLMLRQQFPEGLYAFLMIGLPERGRHAAPGARSISPSPDVFPKHLPPLCFPSKESAFQSLPEVPAETTEDVRNFEFHRRPYPPARSLGRRHQLWSAAISHRHMGVRQPHLTDVPPRLESDGPQRNRRRIKPQDHLGSLHTLHFRMRSAPPWSSWMAVRIMNSSSIPTISASAKFLTNA